MQMIKNAVLFLNDILMLCMFIVLALAGYLSFQILGLLLGLFVGIILSGWWAAISAIAQNTKENNILMKKILKEMQE